ncbi:MAG TPA: S41 family peptidase [Pseudobacter sp.]|nr:S41 family peptidase [Pseudobacter sp.]
MKFISKTGFTALLAAYCLNSTAQTKELPELKKDDIISDYRLAMDILKKQHPNPFKFIDSADFDRKVDSLMKLAEKQDNVFSVLQYSPIQLVRDVHTNMQFSADNNRDLISHLQFFPFPVVIEKGKILVNIKGAELPFGTEIVSINKQSAKDIIESLSSVAYSDGFITTGTDRVFGNFQTTISLRNNYAASYDLEYADPKSKSPKKITVASLKPGAGVHSSSQAVMPLNVLARSYWIYGSYDDDTKTGTLTVNSFNLQESYAYKEFSAFFKEVNKRGYKNVIIDIRNNGGGNPAISALLFSFMAPKAFQNVYNYRTKNIDLFYAEHATTQGRKMSDEDIRNNKQFLYQRFDLDSSTGFYVGNARLKEGQLENFPPDKDAFKGSIYVLTGGGTVSAATYFASLVQKNKRGLVVGKETGSGEHATTAAWFLTYTLPKTKSVLTVPMSELYFFNSQKDNGRGIMPDKEVPMDKFISYMQQSQDPELSYTMELIRQSK